MTTVVTTEAETIAPGLDPGGQQIVAAVAEAAPEVAQIEADRDVAIAEIRAETEQAAIEAATEMAEDDLEDETWRRNIETQQTALTASMTALADQLSSIQTQLTVLSPSVQNPPPDAASAETPASQEVPAEPVRRKKLFRWI